MAARILDTPTKKTCSVVLCGHAEFHEVIGPNREFAPFAQVDDTRSWRGIMVMMNGEP